MHDDEFELDFGEDELEFAPATASHAPLDVRAAPDAASPRNFNPSKPAEDLAASPAPVAPAPSRPVSRSNGNGVADSNGSTRSAPASTGAPGSWGRSSVRQLEPDSRRDQGRRSGSRPELANDGQARPSASTSASRLSSSSTTPLLPASTATTSSAPEPTPVPTQTAVAASPAAPAPKPRDETVDANGNPLPAGWVSRISKSTQQVYYRNVKKNTTCWDIPQEPADGGSTEHVIPVEVVDVKVVESSAKEQEESKEQPKKLAVHPDRLKLLGVDSSTPTSSPSNLLSSSGATSTLSTGIDGRVTAQTATSTGPERPSVEQGRKPLPPQQQLIPGGPRGAASRRGRSSFGSTSAPTSTTDANQVPIPSGPRADLRASGSTQAVSDRPAAPTGPRAATTPSGPRAGTSSGNSDRWAPQPQGTGPRWAGKSMTGATPAISARPAPPPPGLGPRSQMTAAGSRAAAASSSQESTRPLEANKAARSTESSKIASSTTDSTARQTPSTSIASSIPQTALKSENRWPTRARAPSPTMARDPPTGPQRGGRLTLDSQALDASLESYNASRPARSPSAARAPEPPRVEPTRPRSRSPQRFPAAALFSSRIDRDPPPHQASGRSISGAAGPTKAQRRSVSPPLGMSPLQRREREAAERAQRSTTGRRGGAAITASNLVPIGTRAHAIEGRRPIEGESSRSSRTRSRSPPRAVETRRRSRSPVRPTPPPSAPVPSVNVWGPRAARVAPAAEPTRGRCRSVSPPPPNSRRDDQPPRRRSPSPPPRRRSPEPSFARRSLSPPARRLPPSHRRSPSPPSHRRPPSSARLEDRPRNRSPPREAPRGRPRSRSPTPPPRRYAEPLPRAFSPPRRGTSPGRRSYSPPPRYANRRRSPSPPPRRRRSPTPPPPRRRSPTPPRYRDRSRSPPPLRRRSLSPPPRRYRERSFSPPRARARHSSPPRRRGPEPRRVPVTNPELWTIRTGDRIDARTGEKLPDLPIPLRPRDRSTSPPPGNRGSHLRGKYRDTGDVPELQPYVPLAEDTRSEGRQPKTMSPPPPAQRSVKPTIALPTSLPVNPRKLLPSLPSRPGSERSNGHKSPPASNGPANGTSSAAPSLLGRLSGPSTLPAKPPVLSIRGGGSSSEPIHIAIKRTASPRDDGAGDAKRRRED